MQHSLMVCTSSRLMPTSPMIQRCVLSFCRLRIGIHATNPGRRSIPFLSALATMDQSHAIAATAWSFLRPITVRFRASTTLPVSHSPGLPSSMM